MLRGYGDRISPALLEPRGHSAAEALVHRNDAVGEEHHEIQCAEEREHRPVDAGRGRVEALAVPAVALEQADEGGQGGEEAALGLLRLHPPGVHAEDADPEAVIRRAVEDHGMRGMKLHPMVQRFSP